MSALTPCPNCGSADRYDGVSGIFCGGCGHNMTSVVVYEQRDAIEQLVERCDEISARQQAQLGHHLRITGDAYGELDKLRADCAAKDQRIAELEGMLTALHTPPTQERT
jgi:hypothetical protein